MGILRWGHIRKTVKNMPNTFRDDFRTKNTAPPFQKNLIFLCQNQNLGILWFRATAFYIYSIHFQGVSKNRSLDSRKNSHKNSDGISNLTPFQSQIPLTEQKFDDFGLFRSESKMSTSPTDGLWAARSPSSVNLFR